MKEKIVAYAKYDDYVRMVDFIELTEDEIADYDDEECFSIYTVEEYKDYQIQEAKAKIEYYTKLLKELEKL